MSYSAIAGGAAEQTAAATANQRWCVFFLAASEYLTPQERACLRPVCKAAAEVFEPSVFRLSEPCPRWFFTHRWSAPGACNALTYSQRVKLLTLTARSGDLDNLAVVVAVAGVAYPTPLLTFAAASDNLRVCRWLADARLLPQSLEDWVRVLEAAATGGHKRICEWCLAQRPALVGHKSGGSVREAAKAARSNGHPGLAQWLGSLLPMDLDFDFFFGFHFIPGFQLFNDLRRLETLLDTVYSLHTPTVRELLRRGCWGQLGLTKVLELLEMGGSQLTEWLRGHRQGLRPAAWQLAAVAGCEAALDALQDVGCPKPADGSPYLEPARRGDVCTLAALRRLRVPLGSRRVLDAVLDAWRCRTPLAALRLNLQAVAAAGVAGATSAASPTAAAVPMTRVEVEMLAGAPTAAEWSAAEQRIRDEQGEWADAYRSEARTRLVARWRQEQRRECERAVQVTEQKAKCGRQRGKGTGVSSQRMKGSRGRRGA